MKLIRLNKFRHEAGNCWIADLPGALPVGDSEDAHTRSPLRLFESGIELGPGHACHALIREVGGGAFSHWGQSLFFSTSDNSSPRLNRREYIAVAAEKIGETVASGSFGACGLTGMGGVNVPVNYAEQDVDAAKIDADADYAIRVADGYVAQLPGGRDFLKGRSVLELGPGWNFATAMILRAWGAARVAVADRFLAKFQTAYHLPLYREVGSRLLGRDQSTNIDAFMRCVSAAGHDPQVIESIESPVEQLPEAGVAPFDIMLSNAVLEHVFNPLRAAHSLYAIMNRGGLGLHQVDFRDHRDPGRPLEFLLLDEHSFLEMFHSRFGECGNRVRPSQFRAMFELAGFNGVVFRPNMWAAEEYLLDFEPRLRAALASPYAGVEISSLKEISGQFILQKV